MITDYTYNVMPGVPHAVYTYIIVGEQIIWYHIFSLVQFFLQRIIFVMLARRLITLSTH